KPEWGRSAEPPHQPERKASRENRGERSAAGAKALAGAARPCGGRLLTSELQLTELQFRRNSAPDQLSSGPGAVAGSFWRRRRVFAKALRRAFSSKLSVSSMCSMSVKNAKY